jgi:hypothetical protein
MHRAIRVGRSFNCFFLTMALVGSYLLFFAGLPASKPVRKIPPKANSIAKADSVANRASDRHLSS